MGEIADDHYAEIEWEYGAKSIMFERAILSVARQREINEARKRKLMEIVGMPTNEDPPF